VRRSRVAKLTVQAVAYNGELAALEPDVHFLMTLFLSPDLTPEEVRKAHASGRVYGVKSCACSKERPS